MPVGRGDPAAGDAFLSAARRQPPAEDQLECKTRLHGREDEKHRICVSASLESLKSVGGQDSKTPSQRKSLQEKF